MHYRTSTCSLAPLTPLCTDACTLTSTFSPAPPHCHQSLCPIVVHACSRNLGPFLPISPHVCHTDVPSYIILMWQASRKAHVATPVHPYPQDPCPSQPIALLSTCYPFVGEWLGVDPLLMRQLGIPTIP